MLDDRNDNKNNNKYDSLDSRWVSFKVKYAAICSYIADNNIRKQQKFYSLPKRFQRFDFTAKVFRRELVMKTSCVLFSI
jgi:hypothetical protein